MALGMPSEAMGNSFEKALELLWGGPLPKGELSLGFLSIF